MMEISQEQHPVDKTVTFVQVLNVSDVAEAAAIMASQLSQNPDQVMQIVAIPTSSAKAGATAGATVTSAQLTIPTEATTTPTDKASSTDANGKAGSVGGEERLCLICGDRANGVHYNVLSCEGCKSFFLRSNRSGATFTCAQGGNCNMDLYTRRHCPACRMKRCLECGMKVERVWDKNRLQTRKPLIRRKRKKKQPHAPAETQPPSSTPTIPHAAPPSTSVVTAPQPIPSGAGTSVSTSPSSTRSNSPTLLLPNTVAASTVTPTAFPVRVPNHGAASVQLSAAADIPMVMDDLSETSTPFVNLTTPGTSSQNIFSQASLPLLTPAQEQLMQTLEKGYNASTEVLKHLSKDVPLFRKTYWSKLKGIDGAANESQDDEGEESELKGLEPKRCKVAIDADTLTNPNSGEQPGGAGNADTAAIPGSDPLAVLSAATGQNIDVIYKLTSFATGGQISDATSAINVLGASEQGMRVIQTIGSMVQGQNLNTLVSLSKLVGQIIGMGGGLLNDNLADTILGSLTGTLFNGSPGSMEAAINAQLLHSIPTTSSTQDQNGNESTQAAAQDDLMNKAAVAKLASSGLAEALAMLAAMASSSQDKDTIVEMVKRAAVSLLKRKDEPFMMSLSSPQTASPSSSNFYMPTDVGEDEVKTSPFLQSLQRVTSFLTSGKMSSSSDSSTKAKRIVNKEMLHIAMDMFAVLVKQTIHFAKSIPGFTKLSCDDQAVLIKSSIVDALLLRCADSYALDKDCLVNNTNGDKFDVNMMYQLGFSTLPEVVFEFMRDTKACGLTTAEYALFTAAALLSPDRSDLKDRKLVEEMQLEMILALQAATKVFHADKPFLFTKLITKLTTLRDMSILHLSEIMAVKVQEQDLSPLIVELFGLDS